MDPTPITAAAPSDPFEVEVVHTEAGLKALKAAWDDLCLRDPDAHIFLSWAWTRASFHAAGQGWSVLVVRRAGDGGCVAILPLSQRTRWSESAGMVQTELKAGGRGLLSPFTGFLCDPAEEAPAIAALARSLAAMPWARLSLLYAAPAARMDALAAALEAEGLETAQKRYVDRVTKADKLTTPVFSLPASFGAVLDTLIPGDLARAYSAWRDKRGAPEARLTLVKPASIEAALTVLEALAARLGPEEADRIARAAPLLRAAAAQDLLFLPILWKGKMPVAAAAHVFDADFGDMIRLFALAPEDAAGQEALHFLTLYALEWTFANDGIDFHFGRDADSSAALLPTRGVESRYLSVRRPGATPETGFDPRALGDALGLMRRFIEAGETAKALALCTQIEEVVQG
ncbi:GNAT family N-acetyltransferase [Roseivivax lentus]|nr:hypothetical protein [Roseivivax lentus]